MGGGLGIRSTPGQGSTFWVTAWLARADEGRLTNDVLQADPLGQIPAAAPASASAAHQPAEDLRTLHAVLDQLDALLARSDTAAIAVCETHAVALCAAYGPRSEVLLRQISQFEFEAARDTLRTLR
jgi:hypothetical protein